MLFWKRHWRQPGFCDLDNESAAEEHLGKPATRLRSFDIAKGIGMLCIIAGHLQEHVVNQVVFTFHVPLFFFISGIFYHVPRNGLDAVRKRATRLLVPYVTCAVLCCVGWGIQTALIGPVGDSWTLTAFGFVNALYGSGASKSPSGNIAGFGAIWFLLALFWALLLYDALCEKKWATPGSIALFAIGVATKDWWLPFSIQAGMCAVLFLHIGYSARKRFPNTLGRGRVPHLLALVALIVWGLARAAYEKHMFMVRCYFPCIPIDVLRAVAGSLVVIWLAGLIEHVPFLSTGLEVYGKNSLTALCFHMFDMVVIPWGIISSTLRLVGGVWDAWGRNTAVFALKVLWGVVGISVTSLIRRPSVRQVEESVERRVRIRSYDIAKGLAILLVVVTHQATVDPVFRRLIFSFHMPFFFLANAVFIAGRYDVGRTFRRSLRTLVFPYVVVCTLGALIKGLLTPEHTKLAVLQRLQAMLMGMSFTGDVFKSFESVSLVWFVACLFVARNVYVFWRKLTSGCHPAITYAVALALCISGWWLGTQRFFLPWSADVALYAQVFMLLGDEARKYGLLEKKPTVATVVMVTAAWGALATGGFQIEMATRSYPGIIVCAVGACAGSLVVFWASDRLDRYTDLLPSTAVTNCIARILAWLGQNSMILLAVHCLWRLWAGWVNSARIFSPAYGWVGNAIIEVLFCIAVCFVYNRAKDCVSNSHTLMPISATLRRSA